MIGLGQVEPISIVEGKIQARVAKFLSMKDVLTTLMRNPSLTIQSEAKVLLDQQYQLEKDLQTTMNQINVVKSGAYAISDIVSIGEFAYSMENHINDVQKLQDKAGNKVASSLSINPTYLGIGVIAIGAFLLLRR